jgi:LysR family transcriptional regulator for metE and metH
MDAYRLHWPEVEMDILTGVSFDPLPALVGRTVDLVVTADPIAELPVHYVPLFRYQALLAVAKDHPLATRPHIEPSDLVDQTLITYPVEHERLDLYKFFLSPAGVEPADVRTTELTVMILQLVASRRGVAALPSWVLTEYLARNYVVAKPLGAESMWCTLYAAIRSEDAEFPYLMAFFEQAREVSFGLLHGIRAPEPN